MAATREKYQFLLTLDCSYYRQDPMEEHEIHFIKRVQGGIRHPDSQSCFPPVVELGFRDRCDPFILFSLTCNKKLYYNGVCTQKRKGLPNLTWILNPTA